MEINRVELLEVLKLMRTATATKLFVEEFSYFLFDGEYIYSSNGIIFIRSSFKCDFSFLVPADRLFGVLDKMSGKTITAVHKKDTLKLSAKAKSEKVEIVTKPIDDLAKDIMCLVEPKNWKDLPDDFLDGVKQCIFSVSQDVARVDMSSLYVSGREICSSDDVRASAYTMNKRVMSFLLPLQAGQAIIKFPGITKYSVIRDGVYFTDDKFVFYTLRPNVEYSDVLEHFDFEGVEFDLPDDFCSSVELVNLFSDEQFNFDKLISMVFKKDCVQLVSSDLIGTVEKVCALQLDELETELCTKVNPVFLIEVVAKSRAKNKKLKISQDRILFDFGKFRHLMGIFEGDV